MAIDPIQILMILLVLVMFGFMFRNGKKNKERLAKLRENTKPGAEVMLNSGIYGVIESIDSEENRAIIRTAGSTIEVHTQTIMQIVEKKEDPFGLRDEPAEKTEVKPVDADSDPAYGERA